MPIYVYICGKCKEEVEEIQRIDDPAPEECSKCGAKDTLRKTMGITNFQLLGPGWAKDGYG